MAAKVQPTPAKGSGIGKKLGPLPIWAWAVIAAGAGFGAWYLFFRKPAAPAAAPRPQIIEVRGQRGARGKTGKTGRRGPPGKGEQQPHKVKVEDVRGEPYRLAGRRLAAEGLIAQREAPYVGRVTSESPWPGSLVDKGTVVTLRGKPWPRQKSGGGQQRQAAPQMAAAGQVVTPQGPGFQAWNPDPGTDEGPVEAFAPMTAGSIHG